MDASKDVDDDEDLVDDEDEGAAVEVATDERCRTSCSSRCKGAMSSPSWCCCCCYLCVCCGGGVCVWFSCDLICKGQGATATVSSEIILANIKSSMILYNFRTSLNLVIDTHTTTHTHRDNSNARSRSLPSTSRPWRRADAPEPRGKIVHTGAKRDPPPSAMEYIFR